jgi:hypothetical protein
MAIVELTATNIGADRRATAVMALSLGILAVIYRISRDNGVASPSPQRAESTNPRAKMTR